MHEKRVEEPKHDVLKVSMKRNSENMKWPQIVTFFWLLYISAAEVLPTKLAMPDSWQIETAESDPDFSERFTAGFFQNLEKHFELCHPGQIGPGDLSRSKEVFGICKTSRSLHAIYSICWQREYQTCILRNVPSCLQQGVQFPSEVSGKSWIWAMWSLLQVQNENQESKVSWRKKSVD